eukprot:6446922-Heterocapsa_arctica.AAC.1
MRSGAPADEVRHNNLLRVPGRKLTILARTPIRRANLHVYAMMIAMEMMMEMTMTMMVVMMEVVIVVAVAVAVA